MAVERQQGGTSLIDVLDRVLDKGIVIDAWVRVSLVGIDLITVEARVVVASIDTYLKYSEAVGQVAPVSRPQAELSAHETVLAENAALRAELAATKGRAPQRRRSRRERGAPRRRPKGNPCAGPPPHGRAAAGVDLEAKLALARVSARHSIDLQASARRAVDWLAAHAGVAAGGRRRGGSARAASLLLVAEHGVSSSAIADFSLSAATTRRIRSIRAMDRAASRRTSTPSASHVPRAPIDGRAVPRDPAARRGRRRVAHGLLLVSAHRAGRCIRRCAWLAACWRGRSSRLLSRQTLAEDAVRPGADAALQHHQRGHRPDPADRYRRQADHRQHARREAVRGARGRERRLAARGRR